MNTLRSVGSLIGGAAVVAAAIGLTAGLAPASAAPQQSPGVKLTVSPANSAEYRVTIQGTFPMSEGDARDRLNHIGSSGGMDYIVYADDPGENDGMIGSPYGFAGTPGPAGGYLTATPSGLSFARDLYVPKSQLNEDDGTDEVYVKVRFVQAGVGDLRAHTNAISGNF